jgi:hypothetical protein
MITKCLLAMFFITALSACLPTIDFRSPIVRGRVFDASSGQPLTGAMIMLQRFPDIAARTDSNGDFVLPSKTNHTWCVALPDYCLIRLRDVDLFVSAPGYRAEQVKVKAAERGTEEAQITTRLYVE